MSWWILARSHNPAAVAGGLVDVDATSGMYRSWEMANDRGGRPGTFPCGNGAAGSLSGSTKLTAMDESFIEYHSTTGAWRVIACPPLSIREGVPSGACRKLGYGKWPAGREIVYLGNGRTMAWERRTMRYDLYTFAPRGGVLMNTSYAPFFSPLDSGGGRLAGVSNESELLHLRLPLAGDQPHSYAAPGSPAVHVLLEVLPRGRSYRVWNSEGWAFQPPRAAGGVAPRSPLAGPVGRGIFPSEQWPSTREADSHIVFTASPTLPMLVEVDTREGSYRTIGVKVLDMDSLQPATTRQPPLHFEVLADGALDGAPMSCEDAPTRNACAAAGGSCGWCEAHAGVTSRCLAGGPEQPCAATACAKWHFAELVVLPPPPPPPPLPSPPGLDAASLVRLETHSKDLLTTLPTPAVDEQAISNRPMSVETPPPRALLSRWQTILRPFEQRALRPFDDALE